MRSNTNNGSVNTVDSPVISNGRVLMRVFKQALEQGWKPNIKDVVIRADAQITWLPTYDMVIVPSDKGVVSLDEEDFREAEQYLNERETNGR